MQTIGFFELREEIGHSATGAVYRAEDPQGRTFALKTIPYARLSDSERREFLERFHEMARLPRLRTVPSLQQPAQGHRTMEV